jgi:predicted transcriptional regulator
MTTYETHLDIAREQHEAEITACQAQLDAEAALLAEARRGRLAEHAGVWDEDWVARLRDLIDADLTARGDLAPSPWRTAP